MSLFPEKGELLVTTAKVKHVREEVTKKLEQYRKDYDEMHIRALTAELQLSNLQMKLDQKTRELDSRQDHIMTLIDQVSKTKSQNINQVETLETAKHNLNQIRDKLKAEFEKIQNDQKDLRIGVNSIMRCIFEFKTGVISQHDLFCATDLIFSSLEANDRSLAFSPSPTSKQPTHMETIFNVSSLQELASLPPEQRLKKLKKIIDRLSPELLLCPSTDDILNTAFKDISTSEPVPTSLPPLPVRVSKPQFKQSKAHSSPNLTPPPLPPKPSINNKPSSFRIPTATINGRNSSESDSDFEHDDEIRKIRTTSTRFRNSTNHPPEQCTVNKKDVCRLQEPHDASVGWAKVSHPRAVKKSPMRKSKSFDLLRTSSDDQKRWSIDSDYSYACPYQHIQAWRKLIGIRDSSILTGSLPHIHGLEDEDSMCYITPNEFRSIVSRVRGESIKMGEKTCQRVINRVDSFVTSHRRSLKKPNLDDRVEYLSLIGDSNAEPLWLQKEKQKSVKLKRGKKLTPVKNYENQFVKAAKIPPNKETQPRILHSVNSSSSVSSLGKTFDDPKYDISAYSRDIYNHIELSPPPTTDRKIVPLTRSNTAQSDKSATVPELPPKPHLVNVQLRTSKVFEIADSEHRGPKPTPKPRSRVKKENVVLKESTVSTNNSSNNTNSSSVVTNNQSPTSPLTETLENSVGNDAYITLKRGTPSLRLVPQLQNKYVEEEEPGDYSLGTFEYKKDTRLLEFEKHMSKSTTATTTTEEEGGADSTSSDTDSDGYEIPPDAAAGYLEPATTLSSDYSRDRKYTTTLPNTELENTLCEKKGYLNKLDPRLKHWTKRWFILKGKELKYYSKKGDKCRAKGVINLAAWCKITRTELSSSFQLATPLRTYHFVAESNTECDDWIRALQMVMRMCQTSLLTSSDKEIPAGWAKVKLKSWTHGPQKVWIALIDQFLNIYENPSEKPTLKFSLVDAMVRHSSEVPGYKSRSGPFHNQTKDEFTIVVDVGIKDASGSEYEECINISLENNEDKDNWFYQLVSASSGETGPELTMTEKLVCRLWRAVSSLWFNPILNHTSEHIQDPLLSLPTSSLNEEAVKMFKMVDEFITTPFDPLVLDEHIMSFQQLINKSLINSPLRDELYCQVLRQISAPSGIDNLIVLQSWFLFALLIPHFSPERKLFQWYMKSFLKRQKALHGSQPTIVAQLVNLCEERLSRAEKNGLREKGPSWYELHSLMSRPIPITCYMHMKLQIPVHLLNDSTILIECDACSTVQECLSAINQEIGMQDTTTTGFALMSDWPGEEGNDIFYLFPNSRLFDIISIWSESLGEFGSSSLYTRIIRLTYRNRLSRRARRGQESDKEVVLLAYQRSQDILNDLFPVQTIDVALDIAARMAQIDYGDCITVSNADIIAKDAVRKFCPIKFTRNILPHDMNILGEKLLQKWKMYHGVIHHKCSRNLLSLLEDLWDYYGATLFFCRDIYSSLTLQKNANLWLAVHEDGVSFLHSNNMKLIVTYMYKEIATFGGHGDDFMLVVNSTQPVISPAVQTEKIIIAMPKFKIREATYLMASYLDN